MSSKVNKTIKWRFFIESVTCPRPTLLGWEIYFDKVIESKWGPLTRLGFVGHNQLFESCRETQYPSWLEECPARFSFTAFEWQLSVLRCSIHTRKCGNAKNSFSTENYRVIKLLNGAGHFVFVKLISNVKLQQQQEEEEEFVWVL